MRDCAIYEWELETSGECVALLLQIYKRGCTSHWVDGRDLCRSNWLRYINCAKSVESQNVTAFQSGGDIYYRTVERIRPNTELLVWYGDDYGAELGLISVSFTQSLNLITICKISHMITPHAFCLTFFISCSYFYKRRAVAAHTARSRCKFVYALFRDYRHQGKSSTWVGVSRLEY